MSIALYHLIPGFYGGAHQAYLHYYNIFKLNLDTYTEDEHNTRPQAIIKAAGQERKDAPPIYNHARGSTKGVDASSTG